VQRVEVGDTIDAEHHGFAVDHELPVPVLQRRFDDPRVSAGPVVAALGDQAHALAVALKPQPVDVVFDLVESMGLVGTLVALVGMQNSNALNMARR
jgi:hypothetical protein